MRKNLLLLLFCVLMSLPALARDFEYTYEGQTIIYTVIDEEAKTCMTKAGVSPWPGNRLSGDLILPANPKDGEEEYTLIKIGESSFIKCNALTSVIMPNSVLEIDEYAFAYCSGLTSVNLSNSLISIGALAFNECTRLTSVILPNSVKKIGNFVFLNCKGLIKSAYPNTLDNPFPGIGVAYDPEGAFIEDGWIWGPEKSAIRFVPYDLEGKYTIPETVTSIGQSAFEGCNGLTSVVIPNLVTSIGSYAFSGCRGLTSMVIPNKVTSIGSNVFYGCNRLKKSAYPNNLPYGTFPTGLAVAYDPKGAVIEDGWVWGPEKSAIYFAPYYIVGEYTIPETVTSIGSNAFYGCSGLTSVVIPNSVTSIGSDAFYDCSGLTSVVIGNSVTSIGSGTFKNCSGLKKSAYPRNLNNPFSKGIAVAYDPNGSIIEDGWVWGPEKSAIRFVPYDLEGEYTIPETVISIGLNAFEGCSGLTSVVMPNSVTSIGSDAFYGCKGLSSVKCESTKPASMNDAAFKDLYNTTVLYVPDAAVGNYLATNWSFFKNLRNNSGAEPGYYSDGVLEYRLNSSDMTATIIGAKSYDNLQIPERFTDDSDSANPIRYNIKGIGYKAFYNKSVGNVEFNSRSKMEYIGDYAFTGTQIDTISLPSTLQSIGIGAFSETKRLSSVKLNEGLISIGANAFSSSEKRYVSGDTISVPSTLTSIGSDAFLNYRSNLIVNITDLSAWLNIDFGNANSNPLVSTDLDGYKDLYNSSLYLNGEKIENLQVPEGIEHINAYAFYGCSGLKEVIFPEGLKTIGDEAFHSSSLDEVTIPSSVLILGDSVFNKVKYLNFADGETPIEIKGNPVYTSYSETRLFMGRPVENSKVRWTNIVELTVGGLVKEIIDGQYELAKKLKKLTLGNAVKVLGGNAFSGCTSLTEVKFGSNIATIGAKAFSKCTSLTEVKFGSNITTIGDGAFSGCTGLAEVVLPPAVETIGAEAFAGNTKLASIIMGHNVKTIGEKAFDGCPAKTVSITAQTPPTAPNNTFSVYSGKLYLQGEKAVEAYYDAFTCWDRFNGIVMIDAEKIQIEGADKISGKAGDTFQLTATVWPENVTLPQVFWRSTNPDIATVDANGLVTLHVDLESLNTRAQGEGDIEGLCTIIAETLYNDGPIAQIGVTAEDDTPILAESVTLDRTEWSGKVGESVKLTATVAPENTTDKTVTWSTSDAAVATVDAEGNVTAIALGEATITAACGEVSATCKVTVVPTLVETLTIDPTTWSGEEGSEFKITATVLPEDATDKTLTWSSSDETVATVDSEGNVKVLKEGNCVITVATTDGSNLTAECVITSLAGVEAIFGENASVDVYDMNGLLVKKGCERGELKQLLIPGVYVLRSGNATVKAVIR